MLIPHNQKSAFSLQISWTIIMFLIGSILLAVAFSGYGLYWKSVNSGEFEHLKLDYGLNINSTVEIHEGLKHGIELQEELVEKLKDISEKIGMSEERLQFLPVLENSVSRAELFLENEVLERLDMGPGTDYVEPIYTMRSLYNIMQDRSPLLKSLHFTLREGYGLYNKIPVGRPIDINRYFYDSSFYGIRTNPITGLGKEKHDGMDMSAPVGTPVFAAADGMVHTTRYSNSGYGNTIIIKHTGGFYTLFAHLSRINVKKGIMVKRGQKIGEIGKTGRTTGTHLHYEIRMNNSEKVDPLPFVCATDLSSKTCSKFNAKPLQFLN